MNCVMCNFAVENSNLCHRCTVKIHTMLSDLIEFWQLAHDELLPGRSGNGGRSSERTIGVNVAALSFITGDDILGLLHEWEKLIREERELTKPAMLVKHSLEVEIRNAVTFAQVHLAHSSQQPWFRDFYQELRELHSKGMTAAKVFVKRSRRIACPAETSEGTPCGNLLRINDDDPLDIFSCRRCDTLWTTIRLVAVALSDPSREVWLDAEAISKYVGVTERHIHRIAKAHKVAKKGQLYDVNAIRSIMGDKDLTRNVHRA